MSEEINEDRSSILSAMYAEDEPDALDTTSDPDAVTVADLDRIARERDPGTLARLMQLEARVRRQEQQIQRMAREFRRLAAMLSQHRVVVNQHASRMNDMSNDIDNKIDRRYDF